eukprot:CAMPEP_0174895266 /NCGR_PEP_ID=MMETSP0167-20121228/9716_1 /TAXON_ID=38298 /ORGANISM="Rhodella maculata, Strain CCMP736" /LENGTH=292 /DNA_ID=CAMNT_0016134555 /DNA_START=312 /DNA_END=1186 /DNA_ORIENTATION=+
MSPSFSAFYTRTFPSRRFQKDRNTACKHQRSISTTRWYSYMRATHPRDVRSRKSAVLFPLPHPSNNSSRGFRFGLPRRLLRLRRGREPRVVQERCAEELALLLLAHAQQIQHRQQARLVDPILGCLLHRGLRVERDAEPRDGQHGEIVRAVADGDDLVRRDALLLRDGQEEVGLASRGDDGPDGAAGEAAVGADFEGVCVVVVEAEDGADVAGDGGEAAGDDGEAVSELFEGRAELFCAGGVDEVVDDVEECGGGDALEEGDAAAEGFREVDLAAHGGFGDVADGLEDAGVA